MLCPTFLLSFGLSLGLAASLQAAHFDVQQEPDGVTVKLNGKLFTRYLIKSGAKPILWPIIGPHGDEVTRQYPMRKAGEDEKADHPHQRSCWFTHGDVNGVNFWDEGGKHGDIVQREFGQVAGGDQAVIVTRNDWVGPDGKKQCEDLRTVTFGVDGDSVWFDFDITLTATDGPVKFGDTKEGTFGIRVAGTMNVDSKLGGRIINSDGVTDGNAWAKAAAWCDYQGPVKGKTVGIAVMNHPSSFRYPTYWHVRTYGLFAANPFGVSDFTKAAKGAGAYTLEAGKSLTLNYRVLIHQGDEQVGRVAEVFEAYAKTKKSGT
jgi:Methane oxygenase PmoA